MQMLGYYRQATLERLFAVGGGRCAYCDIEVRINWGGWGTRPKDDDATVDHVVPRSRGGENSFTNYALACRRCNSWKGDRSVEEFLADPRSPQERAAEARKHRVRGVKTVPVPESVATGFRFLMPQPRGATLPKEGEPAPVSTYQPPRKLTGVELARAVATVIDKPKKKRRAKYVEPPKRYVQRGGFTVEK